MNNELTINSLLTIGHRTAKEKKVSIRGANRKSDFISGLRREMIIELKM